MQSVSGEDSETRRLDMLEGQGCRTEKEVVGRVERRGSKERGRSEFCWSVGSFEPGS